MTLFERVIMVLYTLALVLVAVIVAAVAAGWEGPLFYWDRLLGSPQERWILAVLAAAVALVGLRALVGVFAAAPPAQALIQSNPTGDVHITLPAIEYIVGRLARQVRGVREARPRIKATPAGVAIFVEAAVQPDVSLPQVTAELQEKIRRQVEEMVGLQVLEVRVLVEGVRHERSRVR